jgi:hypothetical protein
VTFVAQGSLTIVNPATMQVQATIPNMGAGPGAISIDANGLAYISGFFTGTLVWDTKTRAFVRGVNNPLCAKLANGSCRGAFAATTNAAGDVYQAFFGSSTQRSSAVHLRLQSRHVCVERQHQRRRWAIGVGHCTF